MNDRYTPNDEEAAVAWFLADRRSTFNSGQSNLPNGEQISKDRQRLLDYAACLAEISVSRITNRAWTGMSGRGSIDVAGWWEVRSIQTEGRGLLVRTKDSHENAVVLVHVNSETRECRIMGWEYPDEVVARGRVLDADPARIAWVLPPSELRPLPLPEPAVA